jgi:hypothetical protein
LIQGRVSRGGSQGVLARARALSLSTVSLFGGGSGKGGSAPGRSFGVPSPSFGGSPRSTDLSKFRTVGRKYQCGRARGVFVPCASRTDVGPSDGGFLPVMEGGKGGKGVPRKGEFGVFSSGSSPGRARALPQYGLPLRRGIGKGGIRPWQVLRCPFSLLRRVPRIDRPFEIPDCWAKISMWTRSRRFRSVCVSHGRWSLRWGVSPYHGGGKRRKGGI